jgi:hypothetical protein
MKAGGNHCSVIRMHCVTGWEGPGSKMIRKSEDLP